MADAITAALSVVNTQERRFWLHVDLDVLSSDDFPAYGFPKPGGIAWHQLEFITSQALCAPGCIGWSVVIYNPKLDPDRSTARRLISYLTTVLGAFA